MTCPEVYDRVGGVDVGGGGGGGVAMYIDRFNKWLPICPF
jgi:hypothetical protein